MKKCMEEEAKGMEGRNCSEERSLGDGKEPSLAGAGKGSQGQAC